MIRHHPHRPASADERGTIIVELALIALLLLVLASGAFDYGRAWQSGLSVQEAARAGVRVGSAQGTDRGADFEAMVGLKAALAASGRLDGVERIVIYKSTATDGKVPNSCKTGTGSGCQTFSGTAFRTNWHTQTYTTATGTSGCLNIAASQSWCPTSRVNDQEVAEYYGIWIRYKQDNVFGLTGSNVMIEKYAVMRLEPKVA